MRSGPFMDHVGPIWRKEAEISLFGLQCDARHRNHRGIVHGGVLMAFVEQVMATVAGETLGGPVTRAVQIDVNFLSPAGLDDFLIGNGVVLRATKTLCFLRGELRARETLIVAATGIWKIRRGSDEKEWLR